MIASKSNLESQIYEILIEDWDPIGVRGTAVQNTEYLRYVPRIRQLVKSGASIDAIIRDLIAIEMNEMGLPGNSAVAFKAARRLCTLTVQEQQ